MASEGRRLLRTHVMRTTVLQPRRNCGAREGHRFVPFHERDRATAKRHCCAACSGKRCVAACVRAILQSMVGGRRRTGPAGRKEGRKGREGGSAFNKQRLDEEKGEEDEEADFISSARVRARQSSRICVQNSQGNPSSLPPSFSLQSHCRSLKPPQ